MYEHNEKNNIGFEIAMIIKEIDSKIYSAILNELKDEKLTPQQIIILKHLGHKGEMTVSEICTSMSLSKGTVSGILNRMEKQNYIRKIKYENDKRNTYINFTEEGIELAKKVMVNFNRGFNKIFKDIDIDQLEETKENLLSFIQKIKESE